MINEEIKIKPGTSNVTFNLSNPTFIFFIIKHHISYHLILCCNLFYFILPYLLELIQTVLNMQTPYKFDASHPDLYLFISFVKPQLNFGFTKTAPDMTFWIFN